MESIFNIAALIYTFIEHITQYPDGHDLADYSLIWCKIKVILDQMLQIILYSIICFAAFDQILSISH
jgi:hypothetical protein